MDDSEKKIRMEVKIGGQPIAVDVPFSRQDFVRDTESDLGRLYQVMRRTYPSKEDREIFAMIAYQYASRYRELLARDEEALRLALDCSGRLDAIAGQD